MELLIQAHQQASGHESLVEDFDGIMCWLWCLSSQRPFAVNSPFGSGCVEFGK